MSQPIPLKDFSAFYDQYRTDINTICLVYKGLIPQKEAEIYRYLIKKESFERFKTGVKVINYLRNRNTLPNYHTIHTIIRETIDHYFEPPGSVGACPRMSSLKKYLDKFEL